MPVNEDYFRILRGRFAGPRFNAMFLFVTSRCNSLCRTCFYFDKLNSRDDMSFDQIRRISETAPPFAKLWLSGGEPFLRPELGRIVPMFAENNGVRNVNLPTNGLLPDKIFAAVDEMLAGTPETVSIDLNFSLDGLANTHDAIRGVPNNFVRTIETMRLAAERYRGVKRLRRNVATVITRENHQEVVELGLRLAENANLSGHYFEPMRGQGPDPALKTLTRERLAELHARLMPLHRHYARKLFDYLPRPARAIAMAYYLGNLRLYFDIHERCLEAPEKWPMRCTAGDTTIVVDHDGKFRSCELREPVGSLRDHDYDVRAALASTAMRTEVRNISHANCWCTHSCFIHESSKAFPRVQLFAIPYAWWRDRSKRSLELSTEETERFRALEIA